MEYAQVAQARAQGGLKLALTVGTAAPWSLSARALFDLRGVPYIAVGQKPGGDNQDLVEWTGRRNAPVAVYEDEPAVDGWLEIAVLAERLGSGPSLFPDDPVDRALAVGFSAEICGVGGFGWNRRLMLIGARMRKATGAPSSVIHRQYGVRDDDVAAAPARVARILDGLTRHLQAQQSRGSRFLVGDRLSLCDVHWACFSVLVKALAPDACPAMARHPDPIDHLGEHVRGAVDPILIDHRDHIWRHVIGLPLDF